MDKLPKPTPIVVKPFSAYEGWERDCTIELESEDWFTLGRTDAEVFFAVYASQQIKKLDKTTLFWSKMLLDSDTPDKVDDLLNRGQPSIKNSFLEWSFEVFHNRWEEVEDYIDTGADDDGIKRRIDELANSIKVIQTEINKLKKRLP